MSALDSWAGYLGAYSKAYLASSQKKKDGSPNAGTNGINLPEKTVSPTKNWTANDYMGFLNAYGAANAATKSVAGTKAGTTTNPTGSKTTNQSTGSTTATPGVTFSSDYLADAHKLLTQLQQITSTPFSYNKETDPSYLANKQSLEQGAALAKDKTYADMADRGILNSSVTTGQLGSIEQQSVQSLAQVVPGLEANAYNRYQQNISNQSNLISTMLNQVNHDQAFAADQSWREADTTGTYESPEFKSYFNTLIGAKQGYAGTTDPLERAKFAQQGKDARAALSRITGRDPAEIERMFGGSVGIDQSNANFGMGGIETQQAKAARIAHDDYVSERKTNDTRYKDETTYNHGQDTIKSGQWTKTFDESVRHDKATEANSRASARGSGSNGPSASEITRLLTRNTSKMIFDMGKAGVTDEKSANAWIDKHQEDVFSGLVNADDLIKHFTKKDGTPDGPSEYQLWKDAADLALKDVSLKRLPTGVLIDTQANIDAATERAYKFLHDRAYPPPPPTPLTPEEKQRIQDLHKVKHLYSLE